MINQRISVAAYAQSRQLGLLDKSSYRLRRVYPMLFHSCRRSQDLSIASLRWCCVGAAATNPVKLSSTTSRLPATSVTMTGRPQQHGFDYREPKPFVSRR